MLRRDFFKKITALVPAGALFGLSGEKIAAAYPLEGVKQFEHYVVFFDDCALDVEALSSKNFPGLPTNAFIELIPLRLRHDQTIDDAVKIYHVTDDQQVFLTR